MEPPIKLLAFTLVMVLVAQETLSKEIDVLGFNVGYGGNPGTNDNFATLKNFGQG